jgi:small subunit ribosomal protein S27e
MESKFVRVRCPNSECKKEQVIFGKATSRVKCLSCGAILTEPSGGKARIKARVIEVLN